MFAAALAALTGGTSVVARWGALAALVLVACGVSFIKGCDYEAAKQSVQQAREAQAQLTELQRVMVSDAAHAAALQASVAASRIAVANLKNRMTNYVGRKADSQCVFTSGFVGVWNAAASAGVLPADGSAANDAPVSGLKASDVAGNAVDNFATCHEWRNQLVQLQDAIRDREQKAKTP